MMTAIRKRAGDFAAIMVLFIIAVGVGGYILAHQRVRFPFIQEKPFELKAAFSTAQAVTPGQGQTVRMAGVRLGDISKVKLDNGRAIVTMDLDPEYDDLVHTDATALLRPKTGLKDMFIEIDPGSSSAPLAKEGWTLPVQNTLPDINPDEVFSALDADTRDYLKLLVNGAGKGLDKRGSDLQEVFARFEPTYRDIAKVTSQVADAPGEPAPPDQLAPTAEHRAGQPRRRPRAARVGVGGRVPRLRLGEHQHLARRARISRRPAPDDQHAGQGPDVRRDPGPDGGQAATRGARR